MQRVEFTQNSFDKEIRQVELFRVGFNVQNDGSMIQFELPWNISVRHENSQYHKITSYATINLRITDSRGVVVYEFTEYLRSGAMQGFMPSAITYPMQADKRGLAAGLYVFSLVANVSTVLADGQNAYAGSPAVTTFTSQPFTLKYKVSGRNENVREVVFGKFGLSAFYGHKQMFYLLNSTNGQYPFLTIKGKTDMPGVLLAGQVSVSGGNVGFERIWGAYAKDCTIQRVANGQYRISHSIRHHDYIVVANSIGAGAQTAAASRITDTAFDITTKHHDDSWNIINFSFIVVGNNYKE